MATQLVYVAIAYNQGHADITKSIRQGYKANGDTKYYGEYIQDYMRSQKRRRQRRNIARCARARLERARRGGGVSPATRPLRQQR